MVCLDAFTHKARPINPLIPSTEDEKTLYAMGEGKKIPKDRTRISAYRVKLF
jgi:acyl-coenzyme A thioesterase 9